MYCSVNRFYSAASAFQNLIKKGLWASLGTLLVHSNDEVVLNAVWTLMVRCIKLLGEKRTNITPVYFLSQIPFMFLLQVI